MFRVWSIIDGMVGTSRTGPNSRLAKSREAVGATRRYRLGRRAALRAAVVLLFVGLAIPAAWVLLEDRMGARLEALVAARGWTLQFEDLRFDTDLTLRLTTVALSDGQGNSIKADSVEASWSPSELIHGEMPSNVVVEGIQVDADAARFRGRGGARGARPHTAGKETRIRFAGLPVRDLEPSTAAGGPDAGSERLSSTPPASVRSEKPSTSQSRASQTAPEKRASLAAPP